MAWVNPKISWSLGDSPSTTDFNRIENNTLELYNNFFNKNTGGNVNGYVNIITTNDTRYYSITKDRYGAKLTLGNDNNLWLMRTIDGVLTQAFSLQDSGAKVRLGVNVYDIYHTGRKPSSADVGAVAKTGDTMSGILVMNNNVAIQGKTTTNNVANMIRVTDGNVTEVGSIYLPTKIYSETNPTYRNATTSYELYHNGNLTLNTLNGYPKTGGVLDGSIILGGKEGDTWDTHNISVYDGNTFANVRYGMKLWNTNGTVGEWATLIYGPNQTNRRISFGKINTESNVKPTLNSHITEGAYFDLDDWSFNLKGELNINNSTPQHINIIRPEAEGNVSMTFISKINKRWFGMSKKGNLKLSTEANLDNGVNLIYSSNIIDMQYGTSTTPPANKPEGTIYFRYV